MATVVRMPQLAAGGTEAAIQAWLVGVGDAVEAGQAIVEIETEKAVVEYEAEASGTLAATLVDAGASATVGSPIAVLAAAGESAQDAIAAAGVEASAAPAATSPPEPEPEPEPKPEPETAATVVPAAMTTPASPPDPGRRLFASPLVRRLARERGLELSAIAGSGPNGRIVRRDLETAVAAAPAPVEAATATWTDIPHTPMRRAIARRLVESTTTVPHFTLTARCRVDELLELRARINRRTDVKLSVNDFVLKAVASALQDVPDANVIWTDEAMRRFTGVDIAIAVSVPSGLVTPVIRGVERLALRELSAVARELAERARAGRLRQDEIEGGSFSVSNLGMYGTDEFSAIINPPHAGILAVGAARRQPVVDEDGALAAAQIMTVTLSADHRVLDGALAAQWLAAFQTRIENPLSLLV